MSDNTEGELVAVTELQAGDLVDLEGDLYARCSDECGDLGHTSCLYQYDYVQIGDDYGSAGGATGVDNWWRVFHQNGFFDTPRDYQLKRVGHIY